MMLPKEPPVASAVRMSPWPPSSACLDDDKQSPGKPCGDGVMTRSGTFQHHFTHEELLALCRKLAPRAKVQKLDSGVVAVSR